MKSKRIETEYQGVFYCESRRIGAKFKKSKNSNNHEKDSVKEQSERVYYILFKKDGKLVEERVGRQFVDNMTAAKASRIRAERIEGKRLSRKEIRAKQKALKETEDKRWTIDRLFEEYKSTLTNIKTLKTDTGRYNNHLKIPFGDKEPSEILLKDIDNLKSRLLKKKAPQTVKHVLTLFSMIINFGAKRNLCEKLPFHVQKPKVNNQKTEDLTPEQLKKLLDAIEQDENEQVKNLMKMALYTGMRRGELFKLKWDDIDFNRNFIHIRTPKGGKDQKIPSNDAARNLLESHPKTEGSSYVFPGKAGKQRVSAKRVCVRIRNCAGLPKDFRPLHGLRHTYASMLASSGKVDMYTLQKLLTHKSPEMTQRYAHLRDEALKKASDLAGDIINEIAGKKDEEK